MDHTKIYQADLDSPRQELFNGGLGFIVAFWFIWEMVFCVVVLKKAIQLYLQQN